MPQVVNPPRGLIVNSNNDPSGNSRDNNALNVLRPDGGIRYLGSGYNFDLGIRAGRIESLFAPFLASGQKLGAEDLQRIQSDVVMGDAQYFAPFIVQALANARRPDAPAELAGLAADARIVEAVGRFAAWDRSTPSGILEGFDASDRNGVRAQPRQTEINNSIAATIYSVTRNQLVNQILAATLSRRGLPFTSPRDIQLTALKNLFDNFSTRAGVGVSGIDFFEVPGVASAADLAGHPAPAQRERCARPPRQPDLRRCLRRFHQPSRLSLGPAASGGLHASAGWLFQHPACRRVLSRSRCPTCPAFPPTAAFTPSTWETIRSTATTPTASCLWAGPASRFVATIKPDGIEAVSSLPGGQSGVQGNQFNLNLLPSWLTNDTFPLRMDEKPRGDKGRDRDRRSRS